MKKIIIYSLVSIAIILFITTQFGIQIGNVRIGKQMDLMVSQKSDIQNSGFYKEYFSNTKLICLNTWATWCQPCVEEMPALNIIKDRYSNNPIEFLSLSIDDDSIKLNKFLNSNKFKFHDLTLGNINYRNAILNTLEGKKTDAYIPVKSVPHTYIIKNQKVIHKFEGEVDTSDLKAIIDKNL